ncbi:hypothetical protein ES703_115339 [subsurface metagenome]
MKDTPPPYLFLMRGKMEGVVGVFGREVFEALPVSHTLRLRPRPSNLAAVIYYGQDAPPGNPIILEPYPLPHLRLPVRAGLVFGTGGWG